MYRKCKDAGNCQPEEPLPVPRITTPTPSYRLHRSSGQAVVTFSGVDYYLGKHGSQESMRKYKNLTNQWLAHGRSLPRSDDWDDKLVKELLLAYYRDREAKLSGVELSKVRDSLKVVRTLFGEVPARDFSAVHYDSVRRQMIAAGLCISTIRNRLYVIKRMVSWAIVRGFMPDRVLNLIGALERSAPIRVGQPGVKAPKPVLPVPEEEIAAVMAHVKEPIRTMMHLQLVTGMRPGEVCRLTTGQLDRQSDETWTYKLASHKTSYRNKDRTIVLGPQSIALLRPFLKADPDAYLFTPKSGYLIGGTPAKKPGGRGRKISDNFKPKYTDVAYATAVVRGCRRAGVSVFRPNRIRHTYATKIRHEFGLEAAQVMLGHSRADVTHVYAERNNQVAVEIARKLG
jgi:integrase